MSISRIMRFGVLVSVVIGFLAGISIAQTTGSASFAAKQEIKDQVLSAMDDGKISQAERRAILTKAQGRCSANEYASLVETINRLSPPDSGTPADLGYNPLVRDKQLMANFPTPDLSWIEKAPIINALPKLSIGREAMPKQSIPNQTVVVREIITKQTIVRETAPAPKQSTAKAAPPKQYAVKQTAYKQSESKPTGSKQSLAKATKPSSTVAKPSSTATKPSSTSKVVILPPPPRKDNTEESATTPVEKTQNKVVQSQAQTPSMPPAVQSLTRGARAEKPARQKIAESLKKRLTTGGEAEIQQPAQLLKKVEKTAAKPSYSDYSVPILTSPSAALLNRGKNEIIQTSYDDTLDPDENSQCIVR